jgi:CRP-like cAMP-binding protein
MVKIAHHPQRKQIVEQLRANLVLRRLSDSAWRELEPKLEVLDYGKGDPLLHQGSEHLEQYFIIDGILKRVVANPEGKEMILRFAAEGDMDTTYAAWRLRTRAPYSIVAVTKACAAKLTVEAWAEFLDRHPAIKADFEYEVMRLMSEVMAHTITLHLLDAHGRVNRFLRKHHEFASRIPKKELASFLNLTPETLSRLKQRKQPGAP